MPSDPVLLESRLPGVRRFASGKVRDVYDLGDRLLIVATDRISAFDCILPDGIPHKGRVLTQMSIFWFEMLRDLVPTHFLTAGVDEYPVELQEFRDQLEGRSMLVRRAQMYPIECVARGYLSGSGWKEDRERGSICGIALPAGLRESDRLPEPIFTPATKAQSGHDENVSFEAAVTAVGKEAAAKVRDLTLAIYRKASAYAETRGIILADTKFEFGTVGDELVLGDEVLTPDSSRFWPRDQYAPGGPQKSYDKQFVRDYLETLDWNKQPPAPPLPGDVIRKTSEKYCEAYETLTGMRIMNWLDALFILVLLLSTVSAVQKGFSREVVGIAAAGIGLLCGIWFYGLAGAFLLPYVSSPQVAHFIGFFIVFLGCVILSSVSAVIRRFMKTVGLSWFDRLLGAAFGVVRGTLLCMAVITAMVAFAPAVAADSAPASVAESRIAPYIVAGANFLIAMAPRELKDSFHTHYEKLKIFLGAKEN